jgi:hypothetical protein
VKAGMGPELRTNQFKLITFEGDILPWGKREV